VVQSRRLVMPWRCRDCRMVQGRCPAQLCVAAVL